MSGNDTRQNVLIYLTKSGRPPVCATAYGKLLRADQRHNLTQDRIDWDLYDNNFLSKLSETQGDGVMA